MPALLTRTSSEPTVSTAAATEASSVTSSCTKRAPSSSAAARPRSSSRAPIHTSWPASIRRRAASKPRLRLAPVIKIVDMRTSLARARHKDHASERDTLEVVNDLAANLRTWRDRLTPIEPGRRRAPGLRRDEIAARADVSVGYLTRLEQGHATHPSPLVCAALARALELGAEETDVLYLLAGHAPPCGERYSSEITPGRAAPPRTLRRPPGARLRPGLGAGGEEPARRGADRPGLREHRPQPLRRRVRSTSSARPSRTTR